MEAEINKKVVKVSEFLVTPTIKVLGEKLEKMLRLGKTRILVIGETGSGKSMMVKYFYQKLFPGNPFVNADICGRESNQVESALFGHVRGAYTDAWKDRDGSIKEAEGGVILVDDVDSSSLNIQTKLLRFTDEGLYRRMGESREHRSSCVVIFTTNADLKKMVSDGRLREDFYYRISRFKIIVPPLRDRKEDVIPLAENYLAKLSVDDGSGQSKTLDADAKALLCGYGWPGNCRELEGAVSDAYLNSGSEPVISAEHFNLEFQAEAVVEAENLEPADLSIADAEKEAIRRALVATGGNKKEAAELLGISRRTIMNKSRKLGLNDFADLLRAQRTYTKAQTGDVKPRNGKRKTKTPVCLPERILAMPEEKVKAMLISAIKGREQNLTSVASKINVSLPELEMMLGVYLPDFVPVSAGAEQGVN